ncbi:MAG: ribosome biogenesis GTP-binding protein YihA/YsxC [candidate division KSB1 bacterium]|nr:ribosome biogenesis GTP-binding protein YihA/YsxC [candidate division KSB1 bacterium]
MTIMQAEFAKSVGHHTQLPKDGLPQIAFCGRSNVGKSSLINSLLNRKHLAKTSNTPGKTRLLNFYRIVTAGPKGRTFYVVDLPGYGYAKVSQSEREQWRQLIETYFQKSVTLCGAMALIDSRHGPMASDLELLAWLASLNQRVLVVATKADKLTNQQRAQRQHEVAKAVAHLPIIDIVFYSSLTSLGRQKMWHYLNAFVDHSAASSRNQKAE